MIPLHHAQALEALYKSAGVGDTISHKLAFWNREEPYTNVTGDLTEEEQVAVCENAWLLEKFPADFSHH